MANPISAAYAVLRAHLVPGLLSAVAHNLNHGQPGQRLFEVGRCFAGPLTDDGIDERWGLGVALTGDRAAAQWATTARPVDFFDLKGLIETITAGMAWPRWRWSPGDHPGLASGATALLTCTDPGTPVAGWAGRLDTAAAGAYGIDAEVWVAELDIDALLSRPHPTAHYAPGSRFPGVTRDVALHFPAAMPYGDAEKVIWSVADDAGLALVDVSVVEVYDGDKIAADRRAMTLRFGFRADDRTLTSEAVDAAQEHLLAALADACDARRR